MCGICGKVVNGHIDSQAFNNVAAMNETLLHRGPDDGAVHYTASAALGIRRLSIIDLETGRQPIFNEDGMVAVVLNGEIYNFLELRSELQSRGHHFASRSDTEVIVHLYEEMGTDCVDRLRGMFAFALWDDRKQQLMLARDRLGKKPLYYARTQDGMVFASELKGLLQENGWDQAIDPTAIAAYLELGYIPAPLSIFKNARKLEAGHTLTWCHGSLSIWQYWEALLSPKLQYRHEEELLDELDARLREAVSLRLISDVPLGALLSGGIDSSLVVAIMADLLDEPVRTFAVGFEEETHNELPFAKHVASLFGTKHTEFVTTTDAIDLMPQLISHFDEPFADPSALPTFQVSKLAREHVTVVLNGDGGDELFGGYKRLRRERWIQSVTQVPKAIRYPLLWSLTHAPKGRDGSRRARLQQILESSFSEFGQRYADYHNLLKAEQIRALCQPDFLGQVKDQAGDQYLLRYLASRQNLDQMDLAFTVELNLYLPDDLLVKMDRMSMANGLEARSPMLDQEFVAWASRLPLSYKIHGLTTKYLLRKLAARYLPKKIVDREKQGFSVPCDRWFRSELREMAYDVLLSQPAKDRGYFQANQVEKLLDDHQSGESRSGGHQIWMLLMLELWHREYVDGSRTLMAYDILRERPV